MEIFNSIFVLTLLNIWPHIFGELKRTPLDDLIAPFWKTFKIMAMKGTKGFTENKLYRRMLQHRSKAAQEIPLSTPFPCDLSGKLRSDTVPTSAHQVRPGDIDVVGNLGDSLSAGTGISAVSAFQIIYLEERGRSFSGGGEKSWRTFLTLPNILKVFNPNLFGFAMRAAQSTEWEAQFNVAENGATSSDIRYMVRELVKRIKNDPRGDIDNQWKMITLMIGDNDFCNQVCYFPNFYDSLEDHRSDLLDILRYLRDNLSKTIVNVLPPPRLDILYEMEDDLPFECYLVQTFACPCIRGLAQVENRETLNDIMVKWQQVDLEVSSLEEFDLDEFTVIPHKFTRNYTFPRTTDGKIDFGFLGPDCFHFSEKGQARFANDLWNSLLEPVGNKSLDGTDVFSKFHCPTKKHPFIFTRRNSGL